MVAELEAGLSVALEVTQGADVHSRLRDFCGPAGVFEEECGALLPGVPLISIYSLSLLFLLPVLHARPGGCTAPAAQITTCKVWRRQDLQRRPLHRLARRPGAGSGVLFLRALLIEARTARRCATAF